MASEGEGGGSRKRGRARAQPELRRVPWQSWNEWRALRSALFSGSPARVSAALNRIAAWHSRGDVPVAVEVSGKIAGVHQRDASFRTGLPEHLALPEEMLQMMYAMATMRLVNGIVDQAHKRNSASVATRAEKVGLPRLLVDIRHESAHMELPAISLLRDGSKEMLSWLDSHYWSFQEQKLQDVRTLLKLSMMEYVQALHQTSASTKSCPPTSDEEEEQVAVDRKELKKTRKALKRQQNLQLDQMLELCSSARSDLVSIIVDDGLIGQVRVAEEHNQSHCSLSSANDNGLHRRDTMATPQHDQLAGPAAAAWKYAITRLASHMPELPLMLLTRIIDRLCEDKTRYSESAVESQNEGTKTQLQSQEPSAAESKSVSLTSSVVSGLIYWGAWLLGERPSAKNSDLPPVKARKVDNGHSPSGGPPLGCSLSDEVLRELLLKCLRKTATNKQLERLVPLLATQIGDRRLLRRAVTLAKLGAVDFVVVSQRGGGEKPDTGIKGLNQATSNGCRQGTSGQPSPVVLMRSAAVDESVPGSDGLIATSESMTPAPQLDLEVALAEAKEQQVSLIRKCLNAAATRKGETEGTVPSGSSRRWKKVSRWRPCPIGTILRDRHVEESSFDCEFEEKLDGGPVASRLEGKALGSSLALRGDTDADAPFTPGDEDPRKAKSSPADELAERGVLLSSLKTSGVNDGAEKTSDDIKSLLESRAVERAEDAFASFNQQSRPLKGCLLQDGSFQPCGDELLAALQASIHVL